MVINLVRLHQHLLLDNSLQRVREFCPHHGIADHHLHLVEGYQVVPLRLPKRDLDGQAGLVSQGSSQIMSILVWRLPKWSLSLIAFGKGFWVIVKILKDHPNPKGSSLLLVQRQQGDHIMAFILWRTFTVSIHVNKVERWSLRCYINTDGLEILRVLVAVSAQASSGR